MGSLRTFLRDHRHIAAVLLALTLVMKMLVPGGYMPGQGGKVLTMQFCTASLGQHVTTQIVIPQSGAPSGGHGDHGKGEGTCPFSALSMTSLAGVDAALLALALLYILALGFVPHAPPLRARAQYVRPPLRGPPAFT